MGPNSDARLKRTNLEEYGGLYPHFDVARCTAMALAGRALFLGDKIKGAICLRRIAGDPGAPGELEHGSRGRPIDENNVRRLVPLLPQYPLPEWSINLLYPPHRHPSTIVRTYLDFCQSYLPKIVQACEIGAAL